MSYFWNFGRCKHCNWPHHLRVDVAAKPRRWWRRSPAPARSYVFCGNCKLRTDLPTQENQP